MNRGLIVAGVYVLAGLGLVVLSVAVGVVGVLLFPARRPVQPQYTVIWRDTGLMLCAFTGAVTPLDETHILVVDDMGWPVIIDRHDILEMF